MFPVKDGFHALKGIVNSVSALPLLRSFSRPTQETRAAVALLELMQLPVEISSQGEAGTEVASGRLSVLLTEVPGTVFT